jgi:imidazolonepropionase-like amidohydrolase
MVYAKTASSLAIDLDAPVGILTTDACLQDAAVETTMGVIGHHEARGEAALSATRTWSSFRHWPAVALLALAFAACSSTNRSRSALAIVDVTVVDVQRGTALPHMTVVVDGTQIASVSPLGAQVANAANVIRGQGRFLMPGLWDMHSHEADSPRALGMLLASGITGARDMNSDPQKALDNRNRIASGSLEGPRLLVAGPVLEGPPSKPDNETWIIRTPQEADRAVTSLAALGVDFVKIHDHVSREASHAVAQAAKVKGLPFVGHVSEWITPAEASDMGQKSIEHFEFLPKTCLALLDHRRSDTPPGCDRETLNALMKRFATNGTWLDPTSGAFRYFAPDDWERIRSAFAALAALMRANGVKVLAGTDQSDYLESKGSVPGRSLHEELGFLVDAGFSPVEALRAATTGPAEFFELSALLGTVDAGKSADLVLLDGNPLQDIRNTTRIAAVIRQGRVYDTAALTRLRTVTP